MFWPGALGALAQRSSRQSPDQKRVGSKAVGEIELGYLGTLCTAVALKRNIHFLKSMLK
jgi:hypothetical protein